MYDDLFQFVDTENNLLHTYFINGKYFWHTLSYLLDGVEYEFYSKRCSELEYLSAKRFYERIPNVNEI